MKRTALLTIAVLSMANLFAQTPFEGKIIYNMHAPEKGADAALEAYFAKGKMKVLVKETDPAKNGKEDLLVDFENGLIYFVNSQEKTYHIDSLYKTSKEMPPVFAAPSKNRKINGYSTSAFAITDTGKSEFFGKFEMNFWYADSLYFPINSAYTKFEMIPMFCNGTAISLAMEMNMGMEEAKDKTLTIEAKSITPMVLDAVEFVLPADFKIEEEYMPVADSAYTIPPVMDTSIMESPSVKKTAKKSTKKKTPAKPVKTKQAVKSAATKPKQ